MSKVYFFFLQCVMSCNQAHSCFIIFLFCFGWIWVYTFLRSLTRLLVVAIAAVCLASEQRKGMDFFFAPWKHFLSLRSCTVSHWLSVVLSPKNLFNFSTSSQFRASLSSFWCLQTQDLTWKGRKMRILTRTLLKNKHRTCGYYNKKGSAFSYLSLKHRLVYPAIGKAWWTPSLPSTPAYTPPHWT